MVCFFNVLQPGREGIFASESLLQTPERSEDAAQQVKRVLGLKCLSENPVSDIPSTESKLPKVKGKRNKKRSMCCVFHLSPES